ncbi:uncharacterized protein LY79DRAFT_557906 [Colletotrichum navitas]|uniref:Uncharacterized protein n=1 Tax=Colletotrichum navitas TaxID=681940 RepID=A0AAD8V4K3_9PEZI|nr:uncharacterized protein LY79DRAFT_557906 [Colletotrichum navitas]KAK1585834.1 hypothetical protein LY79DRAFT_557906 [Colletotrichum navitas]
MVGLLPRPARDHRRRGRSVAILLIRFAWLPPLNLATWSNGARERQAARGDQPVPVSQCLRPSAQKGWVPGAVLPSVKSQHGGGSCPTASHALSE